MVESNESSWFDSFVSNVSKGGKHHSTYSKFEKTFRNVRDYKLNQQATAKGQDYDNINKSAEAVKEDLEKPKNDFMKYFTPLNVGVGVIVSFIAITLFRGSKWFPD